MYRVFFLLFILITHSAFAVDFIPSIAANDAGKMLASDAMEFFVFYIPAETSPDSVSAEIKNNLSSAAKNKVGLAIIGPDYALNAEILQSALDAAPSGSLTGATIVYVNGGETTETLNRAASVAGATFRATQYSGE